MRLSLIIFFATLFSCKSAISDEFQYKKVMFCGIKGYKETLVNDQRVFFIHTDNQNRFVIWHHGIQYPSFSKNIVYNLYNQVGRTAYATKETTEQYTYYKLNIDDNRKQTIRIDNMAMTFVSRIENYTPYSGSCEWLVK